jgi:predicted Zn-dependent peptidase
VPPTEGIRASRLGNGVRVVSDAAPDLRSVTVGIWVENGSRYESDAEAGISHFLEHLFFKGTERRTAFQIAQEVEALGGVLNAFTGKEQTCYFAKVLPEHLPIALDVLGDVFTHSTFPDEEIERERTVIAQEIMQTEDTPEEHVHDLLGEAFWPEHPLARPVAGTVESISRHARTDFLAFMRARYRPDRILVAGAGALTHEALLAGAERHLGGLDGESAPVALACPVPRGGRWETAKDLEQTHVCLAVPGIPQADPQRYAVLLLQLALGGGMASRLFQEIRERRGRAYSVYAFHSSFHDAGCFGVYVATSPQWVDEVVAVCRTAFDDVARQGLAPDELARTKTQMKGGLSLGLETSDSRMTRLARNVLCFGRDIPIDEVCRDVEAVSNDDVVAAARRLAASDVLNVTVLGPHGG